VSVAEERGIGVNSLVVERSLGKILETLMRGSGGLISLVWWLDNLDFVDDIAPLINEISLKYTFVDTALTKCAKEALALNLCVKRKSVKYLGILAQNVGLLNLQ
jgi:hypothetical protein